MYEKITSDNVIMFAIKNYNNPQWNEIEFYDDLKDLNILNDSLKNIKTFNELRERLLINHFIVLNNVFGSDALHYYYLK